MHKLIGSKAPKEIKIRLMFNDVEANFPTRLACYNGRKVFCSGDGCEAMQANKDDYVNKIKVNCPCKRIEDSHQGKGKCKPSGRLSVLIEGAELVGGCWVLRTTSWNTIQSILGSLTFIKTLTNGELAGIPLSLVLNPKQVTTPTGQGIRKQPTAKELKTGQYCWGTGRRKSSVARVRIRPGDGIAREFESEDRARQSRPLHNLRSVSAALPSSRLRVRERSQSVRP